MWVWFNEIPLTYSGVAWATERLLWKTSPELNGISAKFLKSTCHIAAYLLLLIFQQSLNTGYVPEDWKYAQIRPKVMS